MQGKTEAATDFFRETEAISKRFSLSLRELAQEIDVSSATFFGSRTGKIPTSKRTWRKLRLYVEEREAEEARKLKEESKPPPPPPLPSPADLTVRELFHYLGPENSRAIGLAALDALAAIAYDYINRAAGLGHIMLAQRSGEEWEDEWQSVIDETPAWLAEHEESVKQAVGELVNALKAGPKPKAAASDGSDGSDG